MMPQGGLALHRSRVASEAEAGNAVSESDSIVAETAARIFADFADPQEVNRATDDAWRAPLWAALADAGLTLAWVPEEHGGAGAEPRRRL